MKVRLLSDLHIEFQHYPVEECQEDHETVLVLAGDIGLLKHVTLVQYIKNLSLRFRKVIYVTGNHEFYSYTLLDGIDRFCERLPQLENVHILEKDMLVVDDVLFIGATLWTSFRNGNPMSMMQAQDCMNDYVKIRVGNGAYRKIRANDILLENHQAKDYIFHILKEHAPKYRKSFVITHHAPSYQSVPNDYRGSALNDAYVNDYDYPILECGPDIWVHGHTHTSHDYMIGDTRVVCNPKGYPKYTDSMGKSTYENQRFNPTFTFEV